MIRPQRISHPEPSGSLLKACDTCAHLKVPSNPEHAKNYRVCTVVTPLPANMHVWFRAEMEGRVEGAQRWITIKAVDERIGLKDCELHLPRAVNP